MSDRISQLQDLINQQSNNLCNAVGVLQQRAPPQRLPEHERLPGSASTDGLATAAAPQTPPVDELVDIYAHDIVHTAKQIDTLVEHLPEEAATAQLQVKNILK